MSPKQRKRLDVLLTELGLAPSRERAQALIIAGHVLVADTPVTKPGHAVPEAEQGQIRVRGEEHPYVSRGALKLVAALDAFHIPVHDRVGLDVGASTGGFTEVLLERGAVKVFALDVGHNQLHWKIRTDPRVVVHERVNARSLEFEQLGRTMDLIVMDVSFISITKILPALLQFMTPGTDLVTLIKPQFEVGREAVGKGGIVTSEEARAGAVAEVSRSAESLGLRRFGLIDSPIKGTDGNHEYLAHWKRGSEATPGPFPG